jgi:hypothetical protein
MDYFDLFTFISQESHTKIEKIHLNSRLEKDLGIEGDMAAEFLYKYSIRFSVNINNLSFSKYFTPEYPVVVFYLSKIFPNLSSKTEELIVKDLVLGIKKGELDDNIIKTNKEKDIT